MSHKILTIDDSKTVRIIIKKAFRTFDCEISEAANGVEGLSMAAKVKPDLILLDITMPVMDGVEMLTRLKADPQLKGIPVIMLTAEGGREHVLKIAKLGVRDYIVKPFKDDTLTEKAARIVDLKPVSATAGRQRTTDDPAEILVIEDKPAIVQQIADGLKHTPWKITGVANQAEASEFCTRTAPDLIIISLSLPDDGAFTIFRTLRASMKTKFTPIFGLVVKTELSVQTQAQQVGFTSIVTKPIDHHELETRIARAMNLDTSSRYFKIETEFLTMSLPENITPLVLADVTHYLQPKLTEAVDSGLNKVVIDVQPVKYLPTSTLKLLVQVMQSCRDLGMNYAMIGNPQITSECKGLEETKFWTFHDSLETARSYLVRGLAAPTTAPQQLVEV